MQHGFSLVIQIAVTEPGIPGIDYEACLNVRLSSFTQFDGAAVTACDETLFPFPFPYIVEKSGTGTGNDASVRT